MISTVRSQGSWVIIRCEESSMDGYDCLHRGLKPSGQGWYRELKCSKHPAMAEAALSTKGTTLVLEAEDLGSRRGWEWSYKRFRVQDGNGLIDTDFVEAASLWQA